MFHKNIVMLLMMISLCLSACSSVKKEESVSSEETTKEEVKEPIQGDAVQEESNGNQNENKEVNVDSNVTYTKKRIDLLQSVQENGYYCVPACVQMVLKLHGVTISQTQLAQEMNTHALTGTEYVDLARVINKYRFHNEYPKGNEPGYRIQTLSKGVWDQAAFDLLEKRVKEDIASNDPIFIAVELSTLYPELGLYANHMVLVTGYQVDKEGNIVSYYIVDPYYKVQDSKYQGLKIFTKNEIYQALINNIEPAYIW